jgi:hypothetical protein
LSGLTLLLALNAIVFMCQHLKGTVAKSLAWCTGWSFQTRIERVAPLLVCAVIVFDTQTRLESNRWWCTPAIVSSLALTSLQAAAIGRLCSEGLPTQQQTSGGITESMNDIARRIHEGAFDDDLLRATERLAAAQVELETGRRCAFGQALQLLTVFQREQLAQHRP